MRVWIKDPMAILAEKCGGAGVLVQHGRIVELVPRGGAAIRRNRSDL